MKSNLLTIKQAAEYMNLHYNSVYNLARSDGFPAFRICSTWRIPKDRLDQWLVEQLKEQKDM